MQEKNIQLVLQITQYESEFILETAKATNLSVSELVVLSILALRLPLKKTKKDEKDEFDTPSLNKYGETM